MCLGITNVKINKKKYKKLKSAQKKSWFSLTTTESRTQRDGNGKAERASLFMPKV